eukprot:TRINITY_DN1722_c0_g1_i2.p1 TRINITY_DN1722_c0_g1~~TRINITY_DN1722_c0_g1_i2.p1  ORF type:complete len:741 (+),score=161.85 TRINITY_DN1722_c0_g1_i2:561-2783(+)
MADDEQFNRFENRGTSRKIRRSNYGKGRGRSFSTPYDRPRTGRFARPVESRSISRSWISGVVNPVSEFIVNSAYTVLKSVLPKRLTGSSSSIQESENLANETRQNLETIEALEDHGNFQQTEVPENKKFQQIEVPENQQPPTEETYHEAKPSSPPLKEVRDGDSVSISKINVAELSDFETFLKGKTLSREEFNRLRDILESRVIDNNGKTEDQEQRDFTSMPNLNSTLINSWSPRLHREQFETPKEKFVLHASGPSAIHKLPEEPGSSPADIARAYMSGSRGPPPSSLTIQGEPLFNDRKVGKLNIHSSLHRQGKPSYQFEERQKAPYDVSWNSSSQNMNQTCHERVLDTQPRRFACPVTTSALAWTPTSTRITTERQILKRRSVWEENMPSGERIKGPRMDLLSTPKSSNRGNFISNQTTFLSSAPPFRMPEQSDGLSKPAAEKENMLQFQGNLQNVHLKTTNVPLQTTVMARKILNNLEGIASSASSLTANTFDIAPSKKQRSHSQWRNDRTFFSDSINSDKNDHSTVVSVKESSKALRAKVSEESIDKFHKSNSFLVNLPSEKDQSLRKDDNHQHKENTDKLNSLSGFPVDPSSNAVLPPPVVPSQRFSSNVWVSAVSSTAPAAIHVSSVGNANTSPCIEDVMIPTFKFDSSHRSELVFSFSKNAASILDVTRPQFHFKSESKPETKFSDAVAAAVGASGSSSVQHATGSEELQLRQKHLDFCSSPVMKWQDMVQAN